MNVTEKIKENFMFVYICVITDNIILVAAFLVTLISLYSIIKGKKFHPNLRILFINQFIANIIFIVLKLILLVDVFSRRIFLPVPTLNVLNSILAGLYEFFTLNLLMILLERTQSTVKAAKYENYFALKQSIILTVMPWILSVSLILITQFQVLDIILLVWLIFVFDIVSLVCFVILFYFNKRKLTEYSLETTLSHRFQVQENVLTMRFLAVLCFTYSVYLILSIAPTYFYVASNIGADNEYEIIFWGCIFDNITALNCLLSSLVFLLPYRRLFQWRSSKIVMTNVAEIQRHLYFEQLRKQWT